MVSAYLANLIVSQRWCQSPSFKFSSLGKEPSTSKKYRYDASSTSTVSAFCLTSQSIWGTYPRVIDEENYQQFGSESDDEFSMENTSLESQDDADEVQFLSASVSGRLRLRSRPVFPDVQT